MSGIEDELLVDTGPAATLRLTMFMADLDGGGAERMMAVIANGLAARGAKVDLLLARASGPYLAELSSAVSITDLATNGVARALPGLVKHLRAKRPDVLLTTLSHTSAVALAGRALARTRTPVVIREANTPMRGGNAWTSPKGRLAHMIMHRTYRAADGVIAVSDGVAAALRSVVGVPAAKIATLYNPVVAPDLRELSRVDPRHHWLAEGQPPVVLGVGSFTKRKDFHTLIRAFARVLHQRDTRLILLGEGPLRAELEGLVAELGVGDKVDMPGFTPNPFSYMARAGVYVLSSHLEGLPGSLVQALACGCPSVATDCPSGPAEILQGGKVGPLVEIGDDQAMAGAIISQLDDPPPSAALVASVATYDADTVLDTVYDYLNTVSSSRRRASSRPG